MNNCHVVNKIIKTEEELKAELNTIMQDLNKQVESIIIKFPL